MKKRKETISKNYLDYKPYPSPRFPYETDREGKVTILVENKGFFNRIFQVLFKKPKISYVHLDDYGNFLWPLMDGKRTIHELGMELEKEYGEKASPLYERLAKYIKSLESYGFVESGR